MAAAHIEIKVRDYDELIAVISRLWGVRGVSDIVRVEG